MLCYLHKDLHNTIKCDCNLCVCVLFTCCIIVTWWGGPDGIEATPWDPIFLQCFDTVGRVIWPIKTRPRNMTYNVFDVMGY